MRDFLLFTIDERPYALPLENVIRAERMVEVSPLPEPPPGIAGVVNYHGEMVPVFDLRRHCGLPPRPWRPSDHLLLATTGGRKLALPIDAVASVFSLPEAELPALADVVPGSAGTERLGTRDGEIVLIHDLGRFLVPIPADAGDDRPGATMS
jgi:purine-binding chemotaxis protein CheW